MIKNKLHLFQSLSHQQWRWLWSAYWRLWPTLLRIKFKPAGWLRQQISFDNRNAVALPTDSKLALDLYDVIRVAARLHFMSAACLPRSLVLVQMLEQRGLISNVYIGVAKSENGIASHAWVEMDGKMIGEAESVGRSFHSLQKG